MTLTQPHNLHIHLPLEAIADLRARWNIVRLEAFGSAAPQFSKESDLDLLHTFDPQMRIGLKIAELADGLKRCLGERSIWFPDVLSNRSSNPYRKERILGAAQIIYER